MSKENNSPQEKLTDYTADIRQQCNRLNLPSSEWLHHFVKGLRPEIKEYVVLMQPTNFEAAENLAKLKESVTPVLTIPTIDTKKITQDIVQQLKNVVTVPPIQPPTVSGLRYIPNNKSEIFPSLPSQTPNNINQFSKEPYNQNDNIRQIIREELDQRFRYQPPIQSQGNIRNNPLPYRNVDRRQRTTDGIIMCNYCGKKGHSAYNCRYLRTPFQQNRFTNESRGRDPRIPNQMYPARSDRFGQRGAQGN